MSSAGCESHRLQHTVLLQHTSCAMPLRCTSPLPFTSATTIRPLRRPLPGRGAPAPPPRAAVQSPCVKLSGCSMMVSLTLPVLHTKSCHVCCMHCQHSWHAAYSTKSIAACDVNNVCLAIRTSGSGGQAQCGSDRRLRRQLAPLAAVLACRNRRIYTESACKQRPTNVQAANIDRSMRNSAVNKALRRSL